MNTLWVQWTRVFSGVLNACCSVQEMFEYFEDNNNNNQCMKITAWIQIKQGETIVCIFLQYKYFIAVQNKSFNNRYFCDF